MPRPRKQKNAPIHDNPRKQALVALGEDDRVACAMAALIDDGPATIPELEERTWYSVASVNAALRELDERGWIASEEIPTAKRGRNPRRYAFTGSQAKLRRHYKAVFDGRLEQVLPST